MILSILAYIFLLGIIYVNCGKASLDLTIQGIEPNAGPLYGMSRVTVRFKNLNSKVIDAHPHPRCRFGSKEREVNATYIKCLSRPRRIGESELLFSHGNETCVVCELSPENSEPDIIPFTVSFIGDFTDSINSMPFRYYKEPVVTWIYPRYGLKDGGTMVEVFGENFVNFDQNLRCGFGSKESQGYYINENYMICYAPSSSIVQKAMPFSISLNNQQNSREPIEYVYFDEAQVSRLEPGRGPDTGGTTVNIRGQNFDPMHNINKHNGWNNYNDTLCRFGNLSTTVANVLSSTQISCVSPPSYEDREVPVEITLNTREWTDDGIIFTYYHPPFVYGITPKIGPVSGGTEVIVSGSNFEDTGYMRCKFGDIITKGDYISENELKCYSPKVEKPGYVKLAIAIREDEFSSGQNTKYLYYDTPVISEITPKCGPESGYTQITVYGENFADTGSDFVKCIFDEKYSMNATVISQGEIKCDSPSVLNYAGVNENKVQFYDLEITLNGANRNGPKQKFSYYKDTYINKVTPIYGPITGNTTVNISGFDFNQTGACNVTARFSTYQVKPTEYTRDYMVVTSPKVNFTGATTVQIALNGQQFDKDVTLGFRDVANTFYYYKFPLINFMGPNKGPTIGGTRVKLIGIGFDEVFDFQKDPSKRVVYYRFIDHADQSIQYGNITKAKVISNNEINLITPSVRKNDTVADIELSYNTENFQKIPNNTFTFYILPNITDLTPRYGPLKANDYDKIKLTLDNYFCSENCDTLICSYRSKNNILYEKGLYVGPNKVDCTIPRVNIPESYVVELSFDNGENWTNNKFTYSFYDPYVIRVVPPMVTSKGGTPLTITGFGFANSGENLKVKFGTVDRPLECDLANCVKVGNYSKDTVVTVTSFPRDIVSYAASGRSVKFDKFAVEVSVYNDDFTKNNITIFYYDEPKIVPLLDDTYFRKLDPKVKKMIRESLLKSIPANLDTMISIPINTQSIKESFKTIENYANYTCKYTMKKTNITKVTNGIITSIPMDKDEKNIFLCQSPQWEEVGDSAISVSLNGYDFTEETYDIAFTDPINILKLIPPCGPIDGGTNVNLIGTGFERSKDMIFKWGVQNLVPTNTAGVLTEYTDTDVSIQRNSAFKIYKINVKAPTAPTPLKTHGGLDYISISKLSFFPLSDFVSKFYSNQYIHSNLEYFYYKQPYIQSFSPHGSIVTGGTEVLVVGAWFDYKPEYGVKPFCRFGNSIVEGTFLSTVRITCVSPPSEKINVKVPFDVSLNGVDFTSSGLTFTYYNDFTKAKFEKMEPSSGPSTGGTVIKLFGQGFTSLLDPEEFLCQFKPNDIKMEAKTVPAGYKEYENGQQAIICDTPGGWASGSIANILITFDGQNFMDTRFKFYFYKMNDYVPKSGPNKGNGPIHVVGSGFKNSTRVKCILDRNEKIQPLSISTNDILCPMPQAPKGSNFEGAVDFGISLNGIDKKIFSGGFYYYNQPIVTDIFPRTGPSKGNALIKVFGEGFRNNFAGINLGCKIGDSYGKGVFKSKNEINCLFNKLTLNDRNQTMPFSMAMNNYSFTEEVKTLNFTPYGIVSMNPSSGPIDAMTNIVVKGSGFFESMYARCRFGVEGYYSVTTAKFIDPNTIVCPTPDSYQIPSAGQLPFSVPFAIAFIEDEFNPYTETTHFYSFYDNPSIVEINPKSTKTRVITEVLVWASAEKPFSMPSAATVEEDILDYSTSGSGTIIHRKSFTYQPITCRFGRFGMTTGTYVNRTLIKCITPAIDDDSDVGKEEVELAVALNGFDFVSNSDVTFTFNGPNSGTMLWYYLLMLLMTAGLIILLATLLSSNWNRIATQLRGGNVYSSDQPHVVDKRPRYLIEELRPDLKQDLMDAGQSQ